MLIQTRCFRDSRCVFCDSNMVVTDSLNSDYKAILHLFSYKIDVYKNIKKSLKNARNKTSAFQLYIDKIPVPARQTKIARSHGS